MINLTERAALLAARKIELTQAINEIGDRLDETPPKDWEDRASERQGDEVLEALSLHDAAEIREIDAALLRIANGTYGVCTTCGEEIALERLSALPATPFCMRCAG